MFNLFYKFQRDSKVNNERGGSENGYLNQIGLNNSNNLNQPTWTIPRSAAFSALNKHLNNVTATTTAHGISSADETTDGYDSGDMIGVPMPVGGVNGL